MARTLCRPISFTCIASGLPDVQRGWRLGRFDLANLDALLRLQARSARDPLTRSELTLASNRVQVVSRVQHLLSRSGEAAVIDVRPFILELCEDLRQSLIGERHIALKAESAELQLRSARAVIVGLVMNELVTNAVKYAFPDGRTGTILVQITRRGSACHLVVADDGVGQSQLVGQGSGLGQRLIQSMAQQLAGTFKVEVTDGGRICTMDFPLGEDIPR
ncbi:MAG: sensor histidine kinase [Devosia sp.]|nr:sensor histidine kinase [Devosia sp.]